MTLVTVATCNLNQWALDFDGNVDRILKSCDDARSMGATYRLGPELEVCGYGCEDHFLESDTYVHCWESLAILLERGACSNNLLCDFGMPVVSDCGTRYNCRVLCANKEVLLIRPKTVLADDGNYREGRYFTPYLGGSTIKSISGNERDGKGIDNGGDDGCGYLTLPGYWYERFGQRKAPFGTMSLRCSSLLSYPEGGQQHHHAATVTIGCESCEELWAPRSPHVEMALSGVDIIGNGSGSHHELRKLETRLDLIVSATRKCGGIYLYANQRGCDGGRLYYDGCAMIVCNGKVLAQANQFDVRDVQTVCATVDLDDVRSYRASKPSFGMQASLMMAHQGCQNGGLVRCDDRVKLGSRWKKGGGKEPLLSLQPVPSDEIRLKFHSPEEECCLGPACWLWDFLRRSGASGFLLPLSGGADSSAVAAIVGSMCDMVTRVAQDDPLGDVAVECRRVCGMENSESGDWVPGTPREMANSVLHTIYMGTENSSKVTESRSRRLADAIGSYHLSIRIDIIISAILKVFVAATTTISNDGPRVPRYMSRGGTTQEDLALQNVQARLRMVTAYLFAQLLPWVRWSTVGRGVAKGKQRSRAGFLLVLGSANVDEGLRGYMTKYDCSSADLNPIGSISKMDLKNMLRWAAGQYEGFDVLEEIAGAPPTAELRPLTGAEEEAGEHSQNDEEDMGMTYEELGIFGRLRNISRCGPVSMFRKLCVIWTHLSPFEVAEKVKRFFYYYSTNRHKMCTVTPAYHAEAYSPDDNRFDLRQFLYNSKWTRQFVTIDKIVKEKEEFQSKEGEGIRKELN